MSEGRQESGFPALRNNVVFQNIIYNTLPGASADLGLVSMIWIGSDLPEYCLNMDRDDYNAIQGSDCVRAALDAGVTPLSYSLTS